MDNYSLHDLFNILKKRKSVVMGQSDLTEKMLVFMLVSDLTFL
jgi:hypothetical protein